MCAHDCFFSASINFCSIVESGKVISSFGRRWRPPDQIRPADNADVFAGLVDDRNTLDPALLEQRRDFMQRRFRGGVTTSEVITSSTFTACDLT